MLTNYFYLFLDIPGISIKTFYSKDRTNKEKFTAKIIQNESDDESGFLHFFSYKLTIILFHIKFFFIRLKINKTRLYQSRIFYYESGFLYFFFIQMDYYFTS